MKLLDATLVFYPSHDTVQHTTANIHFPSRFPDHFHFISVANLVTVGMVVDSITC